MRRPDRWRRGGFLPLLLLSIGILELRLGYFAGPRAEDGSGLWRPRGLLGEESPSKSPDIPAEAPKKKRGRPKGGGAPARKRGRTAAKPKPKAKPKSKPKPKGKAAGSKTPRVYPPRTKEISHPTHRTVSGRLFGVGEGGTGAIGTGEYDHYPHPFEIPLHNITFKDIVCGGTSTFGITQNGTLYSWGINDAAALGRPCGDHFTRKSKMLSLELKSDMLPHKVDVPTEHPIVQVSAGDSHAAALDSHGNVFYWGTFISQAGEDFQLQPGKRFGWLPEKIPGVNEKIVKIASGEHHIILLSKLGRIYSLGAGEVGTLGRPLSTRKYLEAKLTAGLVHCKPAYDIYCGQFSNFAFTKQGVYTWGLNNHGQLCLPMPPAEKEDQSVKRPTKSESLSKLNPMKIAAGLHHNLIMDSEGKLLSNGIVTFGRLGRSDVEDIKNNTEKIEPAPVNGLEGVKIVDCAVSEATSTAVGSKPGEIFAWGFSKTSQLGKEGYDLPHQKLPEKMHIPEDSFLHKASVMKIQMGASHAMMLVEDQNLNNNSDAEKNNSAADNTSQNQTDTSQNQTAAAET